MKNVLKLLEEWKSNHKSRAVEISHDNGYGASCWVVNLYGNCKKVSAWEVYFFDVKKEYCPKDLTFARPPWENDSEDDDWPGLEKTILAALKRAEELGL